MGLLDILAIVTAHPWWVAYILGSLVIGRWLLKEAGPLPDLPLGPVTAAYILMVIGWPIVLYLRWFGKKEPDGITIIRHDTDSTDRGVAS